MKVTLGFDVYGTLINTHGVVEALSTYIGDRASQFSQLWREKQLEYTFRRGLMGQYQHFGICTKQALEYTDQFLGTELSAEQRQTLIQCYARLPAFDDVVEGLELAQSKGFELYAFSNGQASAVDRVLTNAGIRHYFKDIISVDEISTFKPDPKIYTHFLERTRTDKKDAWLVSSNGFDVIGALAIGMNAAWVNRSSKIILDPWGVEPTVTVDTINHLINEIPSSPQ